MIKIIPDATYDHLFGPPTPAAVRRMRSKKFYGDDIPNDSCENF